MQTTPYRFQIKVLVENSREEPCSQRTVCKELQSDSRSTCGCLVLIHVATAKGRFCNMHPKKSHSFSGTINTC